jgi:hypothetical protein
MYMAKCPGYPKKAASLWGSSPSKSLFFCCCGSSKIKIMSPGPTYEQKKSGIPVTEAAAGLVISCPKCHVKHKLKSAAPGFDIIHL